MHTSRSLLLLLTALLGLVPAAARATDLTRSVSGTACGGDTCCCEGPGEVATPASQSEPVATIEAPAACPCSEPTPAPAPQDPVPPTHRGADHSPMASAASADAGQLVIAQPRGAHALRPTAAVATPPPRIALGVRLL
jgi:hypothetical protein